MIFTPAPLAGVWRISLDPYDDERGFFARTFCEREFAAQGLVARFVQCNLSYNARRGTLRGMHFQRPPGAEVKLVRCVRGAAYDVVLDLRPESPTCRHWTAFELTAENRDSVYIPQGCAHGFQALADDTEMFYHMSEFYQPALADGIRWDDPQFRIVWPLPDPILSKRDGGYPDFTP